MGHAVRATILIAAAGAVFAVGFSLGKSGKVEKPDRSVGAREAGSKTGSDDVPSLVASLDKYREALAEKDREVEELRAQIEEFRAQLAMSVTSSDYGEYAEWVKEWENRRRSKAFFERKNELEKKILQRKDKALRERSLQELADLLNSVNVDDVTLGLVTLGSLPKAMIDQERFKPLVFAALNHEDQQVRRNALHTLRSVTSYEEGREMFVHLSKEPWPEMRQWAAFGIRGYSGDERAGEAIALLRELLQDQDERVRSVAIRELWDKKDEFPELEDMAVERARREGSGASWRRDLTGRGTVTAKVARRLSEVYEPGETGRNAVTWVQEELADDAKPVAIDFCLRVVRDGMRWDERWEALAGLQKIGDASLIPQLEAIANSHDAEGIEDGLQRAIENLRKSADGAR